jgi:hypothetical protein
MVDGTVSGPVHLLILTLKPEIEVEHNDVIWAAVFLLQRATELQMLPPAVTLAAIVSFWI